MEKLAHSIGRWMDDNYRFDAIYAVPRGGMIPAVLLSHMLKIPIKTDETWVERLLVVDDIADTGETIRRIEKTDFGNDERTKVATLYSKPWTFPGPHFLVYETEDWIVFPWEVE
jgi:hypoxanthine phosphoribosyltransferase